MSFTPSIFNMVQVLSLLPFCALEGVNTWGDVDVMEEFPGSLVLPSVTMSRGVSMKLLLPILHWSSAILYSSGLLIGFSSFKHKLVVYDIQKDVTRMVPFDASSASLGVWNRKLIVSVEGSPLQIGDLDAILDKGKSTLKVFGHEIIRGHCDLSRVERDGHVWFSSRDRQLMELHIGSGKSLRYPTLITETIPVLGEGLSSFVCVARLLDGRVGFFRRDTTLDAVTLPEEVERVLYIIPSMSHPEYPLSALFICSVKRKKKGNDVLLVCNGRKIKAPDPLRH